MKKKILGGIAALAIAAVVAFNISLNTKKDNASLLALANVEALAQNESDCFHKVRCVYTTTCEDIWYFHYSDIFDLKITEKKSETICDGDGSICCVPSYQLLSSENEFVQCNPGNH